MSSAYGFAQGLLGQPALTATFMARAYDVELSPSALLPGVTEETYTVTGLTTNDLVFVNKPTKQANIGIVGARVSAADTLAISWGYMAGSAITSLTAATAVTPTAAETYKVIAIRCAA